MDDVLVFGRNQKEHDGRLKAVLQCLELAGVILNPKKCEFSKGSLRFLVRLLGHIIDKEGISADPEKVHAITEIPPLSNKTELCRLMGMINQLGKFLPNQAEVTHPMTALLSKRIPGPGNQSKQRHSEKSKQNLQKISKCWLYITQQLRQKLSADASSYGLGGVLMQQVDTTWKPVAYTSRSMSTTEEHYTQTEKEALAITWTCHKFAMYLVGKHFSIETDYKP